MKRPPAGLHTQRKGDNMAELTDINVTGNFHIKVKSATKLAKSEVYDIVLKAEQAINEILLDGDGKDGWQKSISVIRCHMLSETVQHQKYQKG